MPRGISSTITDALDSTTIEGIFYLVRITMENQTLYYADRGGVTFDGDSYEPRLVSISSLDFSPTSENKVSIVLSNVDGAINTLDQTTGFVGCKVEIIEYVDSVSDGYVKFVGTSDELSEINQKTATMEVYGGSNTVSSEAPKRVISINCNWEFANVASYVNELDYEGSECPYNRVSTVGFRAIIDPGSSIDNSTDPVTFDILWDSTSYTNGAKFNPNDQVIIGSERLYVTSATAPNVSRQQTLTAIRAYNDTTIASHAAGDTVYFGSCPLSIDGCKARGMYGNNPNDTWATGPDRIRNYFGGFPQIIAPPTPTNNIFRGVAIRKGLAFSGNDSIYNATLPLIYGKVRTRDIKIVLAKNENDFLSMIGVVGEGLLATNATDDSQTTTVDAYSTDGSGTIIEVNGARRHDPRPGYGIQVENGQMDQPEIITNFISTIPDFTTFKLGYNGTAWFALRIDTKSNPSVDVKAGDLNALAQIEYGRVVRVYTDSVTYTRKATKNPSWVILDLMTSKRAGAGFDYSECNTQSFVDFATYCDENVTSVLDGSSVPRWTFNGIIDQKKSLTEWISLISVGCYTIPPFRDADGLWKVKALKSESLTSLPFFSSNSSDITERNILWDGPNGGSTLSKTKKPYGDIPNEIRVNYVDGTDFAKVTLVISNRDAQRKIGRVLGNNNITVLSKSIDLPGTSTIDEAARIGTLLLRAGQFGEGGLSNNLKIKFNTSYKTAANLEIGDIIEVEDDLLDVDDERYFRITSIRDSEVQVQNGGILFTRELEAVLHNNAIYDDGAVSVTNFTLTTPDASTSQAPDPVTGFSITETGDFNANNDPVSRLTINFTPPASTDNFKSVTVLKSSDDGFGSPLGDWKVLGEVFEDGAVLETDVTGAREHFAAVSTAVSGVLPSVETLDGSGTLVYPRTDFVVAGVSDTLPAPSGVVILANIDTISLKWNAYSGSDKKLFKRFDIYRNTVNNSATATKIAETSANYFIDSDSAIVAGTTYYYFLKGVSILEDTVIDGVTNDGLSPFSTVVSIAASGATGLGIDTTITTANLVGKTITVVNGRITDFS